jgi:hypothetical protein
MITLWTARSQELFDLTLNYGIVACWKCEIVQIRDCMVVYRLHCHLSLVIVHEFWQLWAPDPLLILLLSSPHHIIIPWMSSSLPFMTMSPCQDLYLSLWLCPLHPVHAPQSVTVHWVLISTGLNYVTLNALCMHCINWWMPPWPMGWYSPLAVVETLEWFLAPARLYAYQPLLQIAQIPDVSS